MKHCMNKLLTMMVILTLVGCGKVAKNAGKNVVKNATTEAATRGAANKDIRNTIGRKLYNELLSTGLSDEVTGRIAGIDKEILAQLLKDLEKNKNLVELFNENPNRITAYSRLVNTSQKTDSRFIKWLADCEYKSSKPINASKLQNRYAIKNLRIVENNGRVLFYDNDVLLAEYSNGIFYVKRGTPNAPNNFLNLKLFPNSTYNVDGFIYITDNMGRVKSVKVHNVKIKQNTESTRNLDLQAIARDEKGGLVGEIEGRLQALDDGGHLIADLLDGPCEMINIVPMANKANKSEFKAVENFMRKCLDEGKKVSYNCEIIYEGSNLRPTKFNIKVVADGETTIFNIMNI